eukprot:SAG22_NODE_893_length_6643_cov_9.325489_2_plen_488_part_00
MMLPREQWLAPASKLGQDEAPEIGQEATEKTDRPCARVVGVIRRSWRPYCGTLDTRGRAAGELQDGVSTKLLFVPAEKTVPRVRITTRQAASLSGKRIVVAIDTWDRTQRSPTGHYVKVIGAVGDKDAETELLLLENQVSKALPFCCASTVFYLRQCLSLLCLSDPDPGLLPQGHRRPAGRGPGLAAGRGRDCQAGGLPDGANSCGRGGNQPTNGPGRPPARLLLCLLSAFALPAWNSWRPHNPHSQPAALALSLCRVACLQSCPRICSIDPPGCTDIDDALHCRTLPNGNLEVGVHIADVTHFLKSGSKLDEEAQERGTTVYLVNRRIEMLPSLLTCDLCSLRSDVDRLAFSTVWQLDPTTLEVVDVQFHRSVIRSCKSFTYGEAQLRMDDPTMNDQLTLDLRNLNRIAKKLRRDRFARGALTLASPEVKFQLDSETHNPSDVALYELKEANALVEEFMLLGNVTVGAKVRHCRKALPFCCCASAR